MLDSRTRSWHSVLSSKQAATAAEIALEIAIRMRERDQIEAAVEAAKQQTAFPKSMHWQPNGVAQGFAGLAIMCGYLNECFPDGNWDVIAHHHIEAAARAAEEQFYLPTGMFSGLSGLAFATWYLSQDGKRYQKLLTAIEQVLLPQVIAQANRLAVQKQVSNVHWLLVAVRFWTIWSDHRLLARTRTNSKESCFAF